MNAQNRKLLSELNELELELRKIFRVIPEAAMAQDAARSRGPHCGSDIEEWKEYCSGVDLDLAELLLRLASCLKYVNWEGGSLPSPYQDDLWNSWWQTIRAQAALVLYATLPPANQG